FCVAAFEELLEAAEARAQIGRFDWMLTLSDNVDDFETDGRVTAQNHGYEFTGNVEIAFVVTKNNIRFYIQCEDDYLYARVVSANRPTFDPLNF
ncbi:hypothetical protein PFISCL1PPCAC_4314, partial [Pristionchus fissidentatus]